MQEADKNQFQEINIKIKFKTISHRDFTEYFYDFIVFLKKQKCKQMIHLNLKILNFYMIKIKRQGMVIQFWKIVCSFLQN